VSFLIHITTTQRDLLRTCRRHDRPSQQVQIVYVPITSPLHPRRVWKVRDNPVTSSSTTSHRQARGNDALCKTALLLKLSLLTTGASI